MRKLNLVCETLLRLQADQSGAVAGASNGCPVPETGGLPTGPSGSLCGGLSRFGRLCDYVPGQPGNTSL